MDKYEVHISEQVREIRQDTESRKRKVRGIIIGVFILGTIVALWIS